MAFEIENGILTKYTEENGVTEIFIPDGVTEIGEFAFYCCENLTDVYFPDGVTKIKNHAFCDCERLTNVHLPDSVTEIGEAAFASCEHLTSIHLPDSVTEIGEYAFEKCKNLTSIDIPDSVKFIGEGAFYKCQRLTNVDIPDSVNGIGNMAFEHTPWLENQLQQNQFVIIRHMFIRASAKFCKGEIFIPEGVTTIGGSAFKNCQFLTSVHLPDGMTKIGDYAFKNCKQLTNIHIPDSVTKIVEFAFEDCQNLTSVHLPENIAYIGEDAFLDCDNLKNVFIHIPVSEQGDKVQISLVPEYGIGEVPLIKQIQMLRTKNFSVEMETETKYLLLCRFLVLCPEMPELVAYMKEHFEEIFAFAMKNNFIEAILIMINWNLLNQGNIDNFIQLAIENTQKTGDPTIQVTLTEYKYKHIGFKSIEDKFKL